MNASFQSAPGVDQLESGPSIARIAPVHIWTHQTVCRGPQGAFLVEWRLPYDRVKDALRISRDFFGLPIESFLDALWLNHLPGQPRGRFGKSLELRFMLSSKHANDRLGALARWAKLTPEKYIQFALEAWMLRDTEELIFHPRAHHVICRKDEFTAFARVIQQSEEEAA